MCTAKYIITSAWLDDSHAAGAFVSESAYPLKDPVKEKEFGVDISAALRRAGGGRAKLMAGLSFYMTPGKA